jgi:hypothetical protein
MPEEKYIITTFGGDETDQMDCESDAAYERRMAVLREKRRLLMTREESDRVDEMLQDMAIVTRELGYA